MLSTGFKRMSYDCIVGIFIFSCQIWNWGNGQEDDLADSVVSVNTHSVNPSSGVDTQRNAADAIQKSS